MAKNTNIPLVLRNVRLSFPVLWTPRQGDNPGSKPTYEATLILDRQTDAAQIKALQSAIAKIQKESVILKGRSPAKCALRSGDDTPNRAELDGYGPGVVTLTCRTTVRPNILSRQLRPLVETDAGAPYAGCYVNISVALYDNQHPKTGTLISASFDNLQFVRDGEPFGGKVRSAEAVGLAALPETDEAVV